MLADGLEDPAASLLADCRAPAPRAVRAPLHPALEWARSGAMALAGEAGAAPRLAPAPLASCARGAVQALAWLSGAAALGRLDGPALLGERAARLGLSRRGRISPGGSCRLLPTADGWIAVNLARADDRRLIPAWLGDAVGGEPWSGVARRIAEAPRAPLVERGRLLGLAVAPADAPAPRPPAWLRVESVGTPVSRGPQARPLVVDLSSLWAGPLCGQLLRLAGARVVKVESRARPDGARAGEPGFFDLLNAGKASVALDLERTQGRRRLRALLERADIVIESARPRGLEQLGIEARALVAARPGLGWLSLTGYGRREPCWVAFGDDAAAAAGLAAATGGPGSPLFCGDAIADPLAGMHAALAAWASFRRGGGELIDVALCDVVAHAFAFDAGGPAAVCRTPGGWAVEAGGRSEPVRPPRARRSCGRARPLGADTDAVLGELGIAC